MAEDTAHPTAKTLAKSSLPRHPNILTPQLRPLRNKPLHQLNAPKIVRHHQLHPA